MRALGLREGRVQGLIRAEVFQFISKFVMQIQLTKRSKNSPDSSNPDPPAVTRIKPRSLTGEPFLEELPVPWVAQSLGSSSRQEPSMGGRPLEAALGGSCSG